MRIENSARYVIIGWLMISDRPVCKKSECESLSFGIIIEDFRFVEVIIKSKELNKNLVFFFQNKTNWITLRNFAACPTWRKPSGRTRDRTLSKQREGGNFEKWLSNESSSACMGLCTCSLFNCNTSIHFEPKEDNNFYFKNFSGDIFSYLRAENGILIVRIIFFTFECLSIDWNFAEIGLFTHVRIKGNKKKQNGPRREQRRIQRIRSEYSISRCYRNRAPESSASAP